MRNSLLSISVLLLAGCLTFFSAACTNTSSNTETRGAAEQTSDDVQVTTAEDGTRTEVRNFDDERVARVTRVTRRDGTRTAYVEYRDGRRVEIDDDNDIERIMKESVDWIAEAADRAWEATRDIGKQVGDKTEDVADKVVETGKDVGQKVGDGVKKAGKKVKDGN